MSITNIKSMYVLSGINSILLIANIILIFFKFKINHLAISISSGILLLLMMLLSYSILMVGVKKIETIKKEKDIINYKSTFRYKMSLALSIIWGIVLACIFIFMIGVFIKF
jgi:hypothetical protein